MLQFENLTRYYGPHLAVNDLNFSMPKGELFAMLGHNGAGKTTTIKMLVGLLQPTNGKITLDGHLVGADYRKTNQIIGYVPDQPYLYEKLTGREFLIFVAQMYGLTSDEVQESVEREITRFGLEPFVDRLVDTYSHGMKQRTVFAAALVHSPKLLVIDEPMVGLDPHSIRVVKDLLLEETRKGMSVFMSTHTLAAVEEIADRIGIMHQGNLIFDGTVEKLRQLSSEKDISLETLYLDLIANTTTS